MKNPLRYQATMYDCCPTSFINAFNYLFDINEIDVKVFKGINSLTLDQNEKGTSREATKFLCNWLNNYCDKVNLIYLRRNAVNLEEIKKCLMENGCVIYRTYQKNEHYVLITAVDKNYIYVFDPFYYEKYYRRDFSVKLLKGFDSCNRRIKMKRFLSATNKDFALGPIINRECVLFNKR